MACAHRAHRVKASRNHALLLMPDPEKCHTQPVHVSRPSGHYRIASPPKIGSLPDGEAFEEELRNRETQRRGTVPNSFGAQKLAWFAGPWARGGVTATGPCARVAAHKFPAVKLDRLRRCRSHERVVGGRHRVGRARFDAGIALLPDQQPNWHGEVNIRCNARCFLNWLASAFRGEAHPVLRFLCSTLVR